MTIKIIERGPLERKSYKTRCVRCRTKFRFDRSDARLVNDQRDGDALVVPCPVCSADVWTAQ